MTHFFDVSNISPVPILVFLVIILMFAAYVIQIHNLMDHLREERSLRLMFSHYFIIISINLMTVAFELVHSGEVNHLFASILTIVSLVIFYISIMVNKEYYYEGVTLDKKDILGMVLFAVMGSMLILISLDNIYAFLIGALIITFGNFSVLFKKLREFNND